MNIENLFSGIGVVIDDQVFEQEGNTDRIIAIVNELEEKHFPLLKYDNLPSDELIDNLTNVSFLLLDWEFGAGSLGSTSLGVSVGDTFQRENEKRVIEIVKRALAHSLVPIFIFSNQNRDSIVKKLKKAEVDTDKRPIFVENKSNLIGQDQLFTKIGAWVDSVLGVYVSKLWEKSLYDAKNQFFADMANNSSHWPKAIITAATTDSVDPGEEITAIISQNVVSRMQPIIIEDDQLGKDKGTPNNDELLGILCGQAFITSSSSSRSVVGDFYVKKTGNKEKYYINIRPSCDCIERDGNSRNVYLLECTRETWSALGQNFYEGRIKESDDCAIVGPLYNRKFYRVKFKELLVDNKDNWTEYKRGRILAPYITHVAERYGLYIQRQALPRLPEGLFPEKQEHSDAQQAIGDNNSNNSETTTKNKKGTCLGRWLIRCVNKHINQTVL